MSSFVSNTEQTGRRIGTLKRENLSFDVEWTECYYHIYLLRCTYINTIQLNTLQVVSSGSN